MLAALDQTLRTVPFLSTLGVRVEEARTGHIVLRLPLGDATKTHHGSLHTAAVFAVGELAAAVVLGTHPLLAGYSHLQKSTKIKYFLPASKDVTAHATLTPELVEALEGQLADGFATLELPVQVLDGHGNDVAHLSCHFAFKGR